MSARCCPVMCYAMLTLTWVAAVIVCAGIGTLLLGIFAVCKTPRVGGKVCIFISLAVLAASIAGAVVLLMKARQEELQEAMFQSASRGDKETVRNLVDHGADINKLQEGSYTLLHLAIKQGNNRMVDALLAGGADVNARNFEGLTPLQVLLEESGRSRLKKSGFNFEAVARALLANRATFDFEHKDFQGANCVKKAISESQNGLLRLMLKNGTDINYRDENGGYLHLAIATRESGDIVETLLSAGIDLEIRNKEGNTALHTAAYRANPDMVEVLLNRGADVAAKNNDGLTPLDMARKRQRVNATMTARTGKPFMQADTERVIELLERWESTSKGKAAR
jgi:ankyrin repeat protein